MAQNVSPVMKAGSQYILKSVIKPACSYETLVWGGFFSPTLSNMDTKQQCVIVTGNSAEMDPALLFPLPQNTPFSEPPVCMGTQK